MIVKNYIIYVINIIYVGKILHAVSIDTLV